MHVRGAGANENAGALLVGEAGNRDNVTASNRGCPRTRDQLVPIRTSYDVLDGGISSAAEWEQRIMALLERDHAAFTMSSVAHRVRSRVLVSCR